MKIQTLFLVLCVSCGNIFAQLEKEAVFTESTVFLPFPTGNIVGTLTIPNKLKRMPLAIIIAGSGPTDRNCNNPQMKNDAYKLLAHALASRKIATLRYDKRGIGESKQQNLNEKDLRFDDFVRDAESWMKVMKKDDRFTSTTIVGHSEGSLIGMIASAQGADRFVSVAGPGQPADQTFKEQMSQQPKMVQDACFPIIDSLKNGFTVKMVSPMLYSLFRPSVQPYLISWFKYDPQEEIKNLNIPVLVIQGSNDIQVTVQDANRLHAAQPNSKLVILQNMNHVFRIIEGDRQANISTYNNTELPIDSRLVDAIAMFIISKN